MSKVFGYFSQALLLEWDNFGPDPMEADDSSPGATLGNVDVENYIDLVNPVVSNLVEEPVKIHVPPNSRITGIGMESSYLSAKGVDLAPVKVQLRNTSGLKGDSVDDGGSLSQTDWDISSFWSILTWKWFPTIEEINTDELFGIRFWVPPPGGAPAPSGAILYYMQLEVAYSVITLTNPIHSDSYAVGAIATVVWYHSDGITGDVALTLRRDLGEGQSEHIAALGTFDITDLTADVIIPDVAVYEDAYFVRGIHDGTGDRGDSPGVFEIFLTPVRKKKRGLIVTPHRAATMETPKRGTGIVTPRRSAEVDP